MDARAVAAPLSGPRTLVVAPNWVGDVVMALPVLATLAETRRLSILGRPHLGPVVAAGLGAGVEFVRREKSNRETIRRLQRLELDEAVILPNSFRSAWLAYRARIPIRWGYRGDLRRWLLEPAVTPPEGRGRHQLRDYDRLLGAMGILPDRTALPRLQPSDAQRQKAADTLARVAVDGEMPRVAIFPGTAFGPSKRWPAERFGALAGRLTSEGGRVLIVAGPGEEGLAGKVAATSGATTPIAGPDLDLGELAALLARLDLLITNDSGPMHLAAAVGTRCVALFGPTDPRRTAPLGEGHEVLWTNRWCSPCFRKRCPLIHHRCLREIGVEEVVAATRNALAGPAGS